LNAPDQTKKSASEEALSILARMLENRARRELHAKQLMTDRPRDQTGRPQVVFVLKNGFELFLNVPGSSKSAPKNAPLCPRMLLDVPGPCRTKKSRPHREKQKSPEGFEPVRA
jgi:hypothetical protein